MTMKRALITGATGFVGRHLAARLMKEGVKVCILVRPGSDRKQLYALPAKPLLYEHDGTTPGMVRLFKLATPDTVFHLAAVTLAEHRMEDVDALIRSNILFGSQLLEACAQTKVPRFINTGTYWQHYEQADYDPVCLYAATKQSFEDILRFYAGTTALRAVTLKLYDVYGPADTRGKLLQQIQKAQHNDEPLKLSPGKQLVDFVYIDDAVEAYLQAARLLEERPSQVHGRSFAVRTGKPVSVRELVALYERVTQTNVPAAWGARPYRPREVMSPLEGPLLPGWKAKANLEEGLRRTLGFEPAAEGVRHG